MKHTAKLFMNSRSQAVRLPANYRFAGDDVYIRRDPETGDVVISRKPDSWEEFFFEIMDNTDVPDDYLAERDNEAPQERDIF